MEEEKMSKLNAAGLINLTIEQRWNKAYDAIESMDLFKANKRLDVLWMILGGDVEADSPEDKKFTEIEMAIGNTGSLVHSKIGFELADKEILNKRSYQYQLLKKKALFLRRLQNKQGKGTAYRDSSDEEVE